MGFTPKRLQTTDAVAMWMNQLPQWINSIRYKIQRHQAVLDYEPLHLEVFIDACCWLDCARCHLSPEQACLGSNDKTLDLEAFQFILEQVPTVHSVGFSGPGEPLTTPDLLRMVRAAHQLGGAHTRITTNGLLLQQRAGDILNSPLNHLLVECFAHKPSAYGLITGKPPQQFVHILQSLQAFLGQRKRRQQPFPLVELSMVVDVFTYRRIPEMVAFVAELGADAVRFNNRLPEDPSDAALYTLYTHHREAKRYLESLTEAQFPIQVTLPLLHEKDMSQNRRCRSPYTTVGVDTNCSVTGCEKQQVASLTETKIWEPDFWNNDSFQWLRNVHGSGSQAVPTACQRCPNNSGEAPRVLNPIQPPSSS
ncbi:MAG: radical SAM protein [Candidatus Melainabacteria bacterium]|nr:radical SAM protein [Candidatus Melainabacteria bacterium]